MKRSEFEHAVRAAGAILGVDEILVIGSQAIHGSMDADFLEAQRSIEVDIAVLGDEDGSLADLLDGSIGEASMFQETFGYFAQGVTESAAILPEGWRERLVRYDSAATNGVSALCLEPHDLWISKAIAGRPKDFEFCNALVSRQIVELETLKKRLDLLPKLDEKIGQKVRRRIERQ